MNQIIELRQETADKVVNNGDYTVNLPYNKRLVLNEGDVIQVKNSFIDTQASTSQKINIEDTLTLSISFTKYMIFTQKTNLEMADLSAIPQSVFPDGSVYILCEDVGGFPELLNVLQITAFGDNTTSDIAGSYTDQNGNFVQKSFPTVGSFPFNAVANVNIIIDSTKPYSFKSDNPAVTNTSITKSQGVGQTHLTPIEDTINIKLDPGNYSPQQLVSTLNEKFQIAAQCGDDNGYDKASSTLFKSYGQDSATSFIPYLIKWDLSQGLAIEDQTELLLGASQLEFDYIEETNQFSINYSYTPFYAGGDAQSGRPYQPSVGYLNPNGVGVLNAPDNIAINKYSGILFTGYSSKYNNNKPIDFFDDILGLNKKTLCVSFQQKSNVIISGLDVDFAAYLTTIPKDGEQTTGGYIGYDTKLNKLSDNWFEPFNFLPNAQSFPSFFSTSTNSYPIIGSQKVINNVPYGYYLIEIKSNYTTDFFSKENNLDIGAIVSRYYENDSYTSGSSLDSIPYVHKGQPVNLNSFRVRILKPDKTLVQNLGDGNAIYLQLTKYE